MKKAMAKECPSTGTAHLVMLSASALLSETGELEEVIPLCNPHVMAVTETWLTNEFGDKKLVQPV